MNTLYQFLKKNRINIKEDNHTFTERCLKAIKTHGYTDIHMFASISIGLNGATIYCYPELKDVPGKSFILWHEIGHFIFDKYHDISMLDQISIETNCDRLAMRMTGYSLDDYIEWNNRVQVEYKNLINSTTKELSKLGYCINTSGIDELKSRLNKIISLNKKEKV